MSTLYVLSDLATNGSFYFKAPIFGSDKFRLVMVKIEWHSQVLSFLHFLFNSFIIFSLRIMGALFSKKQNSKLSTEHSPLIIRLLLLGERKIGQSSVIMRYFDKSFSNYPIGVDFRYNVVNTELRNRVWIINSFSPKMVQLIPVDN